MNDKNRSIKRRPQNPALIPFTAPPQLDKEQLKHRLMNASQCIELQIQKLDQITHRYIQKERSIFIKIVKAYNHHEYLCGCELADARRMCRFLINAQLALEQTLTRIRAVSNFDNVFTSLGPCTAVIRSVSVGIAGILPEVASELSIVSDLFSELLLETGFNSSGIILDFNVINQEASKILAEAETTTAQKVEEIFPQLPCGN